jgi:hypothetical protein
VEDRGQPQPRVTVEVVRADDNRVAATVETNPAGQFAAVGLASGDYALQITAGGRSGRVRLATLRAASVVQVVVTLRPLAATILRQDAWWGSQFDSFAIQQLTNTRNLWYLLETEESSTVTDRLDIGGLETGTPALFGAFGASWTENTYRLNGLNLTNPYVPGLPLQNPDLDTLAQVQVVTAAKPADSESSGVNLDMASQRPVPGKLHGAARAFYSSRALESDNRNARLDNANFPGPERINHLADGSVQLGGSLPGAFASLPFFVALSTQRLSKDLGGFATPIDAKVNRALLDISVFSRAAKQMDLLYDCKHVSD